MPKGTLVALSDYPSEFLTCRDLMHPWTIFAWYRKDGEVHRVLVCPRCDAERHDRWSVNGERIGSSYIHPEGYLIEGGVDREDVRMAQMRNNTIYASWDAAETALKSRRRKK